MAADVELLDDVPVLGAVALAGLEGDDVGGAASRGIEGGARRMGEGGEARVRLGRGQRHERVCARLCLRALRDDDVDLCADLGRDVDVDLALPLRLGLEHVHAG